MNSAFFDRRSSFAGVIDGMHLDHTHLIGMTRGLMLAGGALKSYDPDPEHVMSSPNARIAESEEEIRSDSEGKRMAAVTCERVDTGSCLFAEMLIKESR